MIPISDGGRPRGSFPIVNAMLLGLNALVFLYEIAVGGVGFLFGADSVGIVVFFLKFGFIPAELSSGQAFQALPIGPADTVDIATPVWTWVTIFSSMFIHGGLMHFIGNMLFLWVFGDNIEDTFGHLKYLAFYLIAGVLATLAHFAIDTASQTPLVGGQRCNLRRDGRLPGALPGQPNSHPHNLLPDNGRGTEGRLVAAHLDRVASDPGRAVNWRKRPGQHGLLRPYRRVRRGRGNGRRGQVVLATPARTNVTPSDNLP